MITAQTGTGKTLAYATPMIQNLKMEEINAGVQLTTPHRPRGLIIVPNRELAIQAESVFKSFLYNVPLKHYAAYPGTKIYREFSKIKEGFDVMITTLDRLARHRNAK